MMKMLKIVLLVMTVAAVFGCKKKEVGLPANAPARGTVKQDTLSSAKATILSRAGVAAPAVDRKNVIYADDPRLKVPDFVCGESRNDMFGDDSKVQVCIDVTTGVRYLKGYEGYNGGPILTRLWEK